MADEYSDILGAGTLPIGPKNTGFWSSLSLTSRTFLLFVLLFASYAVLGRLWGAFWKWREREYRLSMRRKYGIPDNDHRPFNVAYAAAQLAREQEDKQRGKRGTAVQPPTRVSSSREHRDGYSDSIRHRPAPQHSSGPANFPGSISEGRSYLVPGGNSSHLNAYDDHPHSYNRVTFADGYNTSASPLDIHAELAPVSPSTRRAGERKNLGILKSSNHNYPREDYRKRALGGDDLDEQFDSKKTRVEGEELIDGDEEPEWQNNGHGRALSSYSRGSKRGFDEGDIRERDKRQRKVSAEKMEVDEDVDVVGDLVSVSPSRGRKRDRTEAGSSFGGDDDDENVAMQEDYGGRSRHRKRRNKRTSDAYSGRSRKRDREVHDAAEYSDSNEDSTGANPSRGSKKKGKKHQQRSEDEKGSDISMDESHLVRSTIKGRRIGEEWTSNGVNYKISPNGQRLRETLLKKAKQRFVMPEDSMHPDRNAFHDVYVEAWLTDEEYQNFAAQGIIYEPPKDLETPSSSSSPKSTPPLSKGKHLLWESTLTHPSTPPLANPFESVRKTPDGSANAFASRSLGLQVSLPKNGRIASAFRSSANADLASGPPSPSLADSTNSLSSPRAGRYRQYSKWEKQDMEAQAMMRMREANNQKKEDEDRLAREKEQDARAKAATTPAPTVPTISFTKPPEDQAKESAPKSTISSPFSLSSPGTSSGTSVPLGSAPKLTLGATTPTGSSNILSSTADTKPKAPSPLSFSFAPSPSNATSSTSATSAAPSGLSFTPSASSLKSQEVTSVAPKPAASPGFFAQSPSLSNKTQEGAKSLGLGFPSSTTPSQNQTTPNAFPPPAFTSTATPSTALVPTTTPKFNFGLPSKPAAPPAAESHKETTPNTGSGSTNPLLARLSPAGDGNAKPQNVPPTSGSTMPVFFLAKPTPPTSSVTSSSSNLLATQGQKPSESQAQQATPPSSSSGATAPLKFSFSAFKAPTTSTTSAPPTTASSNETNAAAAEPKLSTQNVFGFSTKPQESGNTTTNTGTLKFNFGATGGSNGTASTPGTSAFKGSGSTPPTGATTGATSPFGSTFGIPVAIPSEGATPATEAKEQPKSTPVFGASTTSFGNSGAPNAFGSGSNVAPSVFGSGSAPSNIFGSKVDSTSSSKPEVAAPPPTFGNTGFGVFTGKPQDSASSSSAPKSTFTGFGAASTSASNGMSSTLAPTSSPFGAGNAFGSSALPGSNTFGSASKPPFSFGASNTSTPADKSDSASKPATSFAFGGSTTPVGTPAPATKSPFSFDAQSSITSSGTSSGSPFSFGSNTNATVPASSPFGATGGTAPAFGAFGANNSSTSSTTSNSFGFGITPSSSQQAK